MKERRKVERRKRDTEAMREMIYIYIYQACEISWDIVVRIVRG